MCTGPALRPGSLWVLYVVRETVSVLIRVSHSLPPDSIKKTVYTYSSKLI